MKKIAFRKPISHRRPLPGMPAAPKFLNDLYCDLRDRRLLLPIAALLVAIVAVPLLLSNSSPAPLPPAVPAATDQAAAVTPAVLAESSGVRDYQKRLVALKRTNPFEQQFTNQPKSASVRVDSGNADGSITVQGSGSSTTPAPTSSSPSSTATTGTSVAVPTNTGAPSTSGAPPSTSGAPTVNPTGSPSGGSDPGSPAPDDSSGEPTLYTGTADITFGPLGDATRYRAVKRFEMLPDEKLPVVAFLGLSVDAQRGYFLIANDVSETSGDGSCSPKRPSPCQILALSIGDQRTLKVEVKQQTYRLRLTGTNIDQISDPGGN